MSTPRRVALPAVDGLALAGLVYEPADPNGRAIIVNGATGVRQRLYKRYASFLAQAGFTVVTYDYRGMGDSEVSPQVWREIRAADWARKDFAGVLRWVSDELNPGGVAVAGHSIGAHLLALVDDLAPVDAMLLVAAQSGYYRLWPMHHQPRLWLAWHVALPLFAHVLGRFPGYFLGGSAEDLPPGMARDWARWCRNPHYLVDEGGQPLRGQVPAYDRPVLSLSFADDVAFGPKRAVEEFATWFKSTAVERRHHAPSEFGVRRIGHFNFFRDAELTPLWQETADWLVRNTTGARQ